MTQPAEEKAIPQSGSPWYASGLRFRCTQCGNCCTGSPGVVWVDDEEIAAIARATGKSLGEILHFQTRLQGGRRTLREHANGDCVFLDANSRRCTIYDNRPKQCRTWPFWNSNLESTESWAGLSPGCPGVGKGDLVPLAEIEKRAAEIDI